MWRRRTASALVGLGLAVLTAAGQPPAADTKPAPTKPAPAASGLPPAADTRPADKAGDKKPADTVDAQIEAALATDPDVRIARLKQDLAAAELAKARLQATHRVISLRAAVEEQKRGVVAAERRMAHVREMMTKGVVAEVELLNIHQNVESARAGLAQAETELKLAVGGAPGGRAATALADDIHRTAARGAACTACHTDDKAAYQDWLARPPARPPVPATETVHDRLAQAWRAAGQRYSVPLPPAPVAERLRAVLDKKVKLGARGATVEFDQALEVFRKEAGLDTPVRYSRGIAGQVETFGEELPVGTWIQLFADTHPDVRFLVRDYGILVTARENAPPDAVSVLDFWKNPPAAGAAAGRPHEFDRAKLPTRLKVKSGETVVVTEAARGQDVATLKVQSDDPAVTVNGETAVGPLRIVIRAEKAGKARVSWKYSTADGKTFGHDGLTVEVE